MKTIVSHSPQTASSEHSNTLRSNSNTKHHVHETERIKRGFHFSNFEHQNTKPLTHSHNTRAFLTFFNPPQNRKTPLSFLREIAEITEIQSKLPTTKVHSSSVTVPHSQHPFHSDALHSSLHFCPSSLKSHPIGCVSPIRSSPCW